MLWCGCASDGGLSIWFTLLERVEVDCGCAFGLVGLMVVCVICGVFGDLLCFSNWAGGVFGLRDERDGLLVGSGV